MSIYIDDDEMDLTKYLSGISENLSDISAEVCRNSMAVEKLSESVFKLEKRLEILGVFFAENIQHFSSQFNSTQEGSFKKAGKESDTKFQ
jgi:hypothetical protein